MRPSGLPCRTASSLENPTLSSHGVGRGASLLVFAVLAACGGDVPTDPAGPTATLTGAPRTLTGATSTPLLPTAAPTNVQAKGDARGLNASGQVTGAVHGLVDDVADFKPYRWNSGSGVVMLAGCCDTQRGTDINDAGVVVGTAQTSLTAGTRGFAAAGTSMLSLPILPGANPEWNAGALAINDAGQIAGYSPAGDFSTATHAVLWSATGVIRDLGTLGGTNSMAIDVNASGQVIGSSQIDGDAATHFFLWTAAAGTQDLSAVISPAITGVVEINDAGQITGTYTTASGQSHAFLYTPGSGLRDLGTLGGATSAPTGLNDAGLVVGTSTTAQGATHAFLWMPTDGMADITAVTGITNVGRLNDALQTVSGYVAPSAPVELAKAGIPRLVQLKVTPAR